ncbi:MAG: transglycosylase family protein [Solirubrobacteraceae bacterium]
MKPKKLLALCGACAVTGAPAAAALAAGGPTSTPSPLAPHSPIASALAKRQAEHEVLRLARRKARLTHRDVSRGYVHRVQAWSPARLRRERRSLRADIRALRRTGGAPDVPVPAVLQSIAACESGGNPRAVGGGATFRGKYQFDYGTWARVGGSGDPAAAPEAEQDRRAAMLYARAGSSPWPVCGR